MNRLLIFIATFFFSGEPLLAAGKPLFSPKEKLELKRLLDSSYLNEKHRRMISLNSQWTIKKIVGYLSKEQKALLLREMKNNPWQKLNQRDYDQIFKRLLRNELQK